MKTVLMCPPTFYGCSYVINPWMEDNIGKVDRDLAMQQWLALKDSVEKYVIVKTIDPDERFPDMVYTANAGVVLKGGVITPSRFRHEERQGEQKVFRTWFAGNNYEMLGVPPGNTFEGEGDTQHDHKHKITWMGWGPRSIFSAIEFIGAQGFAQYPIAPLQLVDERFYHLDTCFCPLPNGEILYYPPAIDEKSRDLMSMILDELETHMIEVSEEDAMRFACNLIAIDDTVLLTPIISPELKAQLEERGYQVIEHDLSEFIKTGGAAKCLTMYLPV